MRMQTFWWSAAAALVLVSASLPVALTQQAWGQETASQVVGAEDARLAPMLRTHYPRLSQAYAERDQPMVLAYRAQDFYVEAPGGVRLDYGQMAQSLTTFFSTSNGGPITVAYDVQCARMSGEAEAQFVVVQTISRTMPFDNQPHEVVSDVTQLETWRLLPEGWRLASISDIRDPHRWVNGAQIDPYGIYDPNAPAYTPPPAQPIACDQALASAD